MQVKRTKTLYNVTVVFKNGMTRNVKVRAASRDAAERRALKFHPNATGVQRNS